MTSDLPEKLGIIAGKGAYPRLLAESAKAQGVQHVFAVAFTKETDPVIKDAADDVQWVYIGQLGKMLAALENSGVKHVVMAGQITPTHLFRVRMDARMLALLKNLSLRNAETIFGAIGEELKAIGIELIPASTFMESHMPDPGVLTKRAPTPTEQDDIHVGIQVAQTTSALDIGQTVVIKEGTILAVEAFEGTDATITRAGKLGGPGSVIVKVAKRGHDMRFDIPVIGMHTMKVLKKTKASALAIEAGRSIILERDRVIRQADRQNVAIIAMEPEDPS